MSKKEEKALKEQRDQIIDVLREMTFFQFDPAIVHKQVIPYATYSPWVNDQQFQHIYEQIKDNTLVDIYRCYALWTMVRDMKNMEGDIVEVGVWRGGTGALLSRAAETSPSTTVYLADTFTGVVKATDNDTVYRGGEHADTSEQIVKDLLQKTGSKNTKILTGIFPDDFLSTVKIDKIKLCHIDVDTYLSGKEIFDYVWPKIEVGGMVVFDDYGCWTCEGITKYVNELDLENGKRIHNLNGHGLIIKFKK